MTPETCRNGTERCAAVARDARRRLRRRRQPAGRRAADPALVRLGADRRRCGPTRAAQVATPVLRCDAAALAGFLEDRRHGRVGATTAVFDRAGRALYFSKEVIPYTGRPLGAGEEIPVFHHVGVYAYRRAALAAYAGWPIGPLETWEGLEQLRFMENGDAGALRRGRGARPGVLGAQQPERRAADRGDPARARAAVSSVVRRDGGRRLYFARPATNVLPAADWNDRARAALSSGVDAGVSW